MLADENEAGFEEFVSFFLSEQSLRHRELCKIIISQKIIRIINYFGAKINNLLRQLTFFFRVQHLGVFYSLEKLFVNFS